MIHVVAENIRDNNKKGECPVCVRTLRNNEAKTFYGMIVQRIIDKQTFQGEGLYNHGDALATHFVIEEAPFVNSV